MSGRLSWPGEICKEPECGNEIVVKVHQLCSMHYTRWLLRNSIDEMHVIPCAGECGKRVHTAKYVVVPGIAQGHGPGMAWCDGCARKRVPDPMERHLRKGRGKCRRCKRPMQTGKPEEGFVRYQARGLCHTCYGRYYSPVDLDMQAKKRKLTPEKVASIKRRLSDGESQRSLSLAYNVSKDSIYRIANNITWRNVDATPNPN